MIITNLSTDGSRQICRLSVCVGLNTNYNVINALKIISQCNNVENGYVNYYDTLFLYGDNDLQLKATSNKYYAFDSYMHRDNITSYVNSNTTYLYTSGTRLPYKFAYWHWEYSPNTLSMGDPILLNTYGGDRILLENSSDVCDITDCANKKLVFAYNLIPNTTYTLKVYKNGLIISLKTYKTDGRIRLLTMEGVLNIRDCGGIKIGDNLFIKYGKIFRGSLLLPKYYNNYTGGKYNWTLLRRYLSTDSSTDTIVDGGATENDVNVMLNRFNIVTDIDLRNPSSKTGTNKLADGNYNFFAPSDNVEHYSIYVNSGNKTVAAYSTLFGTNGIALFKLFMLKLVQSLANGAVYIHCLQGLDRTGCFLAALQLLLGASVDNVIKDYELSQLWMADEDGNVYGRYKLNTDESTTNTFNTSGSLYDYVYSKLITDSDCESYLNLLKGLLIENYSVEPEVEPLVEPEVEEVLFLHPGRYSISSVSDNEFRRFNYKSNDYDLWAHILVPVSLGDVIKLTYSCTTGFPIYFIVHNSDTLFNNIRTGTSNLTPTVLASRCLLRAGDGDGDFLILIATSDGVTTCTDTITISENGKYLHVGVGCYSTDGIEGYVSINDPNSGQHHKATVKIYKNNTLIFG